MRSVSPSACEAIGLLCPLVFSVMGSLVDSAVFVCHGNHLAPA
jgi:hypothetical protein